MARDFSGTAQYLFGDDDAHTDLRITGDCTLLCTFTTDIVSGGYRALMNIGDSSNGDSEGKNILWGIFHNDDEFVWFHEYGSGANTLVTLPAATFTIATGTEYRCAFIRDATAKTIRFIVDGTDHGTVGYSNNATGGGDTTVFVGIGAAVNKVQTVIQLFNGRISECAVYDSALTAADALQYTEARAVPSLVKPASLVEYWPLVGNNSPETATRLGEDLTVTGATKSVHPAMVYPAAQVLHFPPAAAASGFQPAWARNANQIIQQVAR